MGKLLRRCVAAGAIVVSAGLVATGANAATIRQFPDGRHAPAIAASASEGNCANDPSNGNCDGAWISEGGPCWDTSYIVQPDNGGEYFYSQNGYSFETDLRYSTSCDSNFSVTTVTATPAFGVYDFSGKVRRAAGPDGPYLMEHGGWYLAYPWSGGAVVISPLVYAPDNAAQACFSNQSNDQVGCTSWF
jgi:hypothetical protein